MNDYSVLDYALAYAAQGLRVFPCHSIRNGRCTCSNADCEVKDWGKHPRTAHGFKDGTTDAEQIKQWWSKWQDANIGIATGNGLAVLDCDPRHGGDHVGLLRFQLDHEPLPDTPQASTGGGWGSLLLAHC